MNDILIIRSPKTKEEYNLMSDLKWRVLREPWDQPRESGKFIDIKNGYQLIAIVEDEIIGTAHYKKINDTVAIVKDVVVKKKYRRRGVARNLMEALEITASKQGLNYLVLQAREGTITIFKKLGYDSVGEGPLLFGIMKQEKMTKKIRKNKWDVLRGF